MLIAVATMAGVACTPPPPPVIEIPLHCVFGGNPPPAEFDQPALVSVTAPAAIGVGVPFTVTFQTTLPSLSPAAIAVYDLAISTTYVVSGPVTPTGPVTFDQIPQDVPLGGTVTFTTFSTSYTATAAGTMDIQFTDLDYEFAYSSGGGTVLADCTPTSPSVTVASVIVVG